MKDGWPQAAPATLDLDALHWELQSRVPGLLEPDWPHGVAAASPVWVEPEVVAAMASTAAAVERVVHLPGWQERIEAMHPGVFEGQGGAPAGVFTGFDFHVGPDGPRLIEINTNAGGILLSLAIVRAHRACCPAGAGWMRSPYDTAGLEAAITAMFVAEHRRRIDEAPLRRVAIVDDAPATQFLHSEFELFRALFAQAGLDAAIVDPTTLHVQGGRLVGPQGEIDLVYNRLVDFTLDEPGHAALAEAWRAGLVTVTPHPEAWARYADKRHLVLLSDAEALAGLGASADDIATLVAHVPRTVLVDPGNADALWRERGRWFFKPFGGYGSRAVYRGDKITRSRFAEVAAGGYVAQMLVPPGEIEAARDGERCRLRVDLRNWTWQGRVQWLAARLWHGQAANMRTLGGGFAPVFLAGPGRGAPGGPPAGARWTDRVESASIMNGSSLLSGLPPAEAHFHSHRPSGKGFDMAKRRIETAAVLGSGVMGSGIAGVLAGAGIKTYLLDIPPKEGKDRSQLAKDNLKAALKSKPETFYSPNDAELVIPGNFGDDLDKLAECDWVVEVVVENLEIKKSLIARVAAKVGPNTIVSSNTSGIDIDAIAEGLPADFRRRWLGTHFFNPARYMKLLELIPGKDTDREILDFVAQFGTDVLGKGIIWAKNTPNFIANRIGAYGMMYTVNQMLEQGLTIPEVDAILGKPLGRPKTAVFKTADLVGLDTLVHVANNIYPAIPQDPYRDAFKVPPFISTMIEHKQLGNKTKGGFYKKVNGERYVLDYTTGEYIPLEKVKFGSVEGAKGIESTADRVRAIVMQGDDKAAQFAWKVTAQTLVYSAGLVPEIADRIVEIDRGMKWGYNWEMGPFETWDALGVRDSVARMEADGLAVPENVKKMLASGAERFYDERADGVYFYDLVAGSYKKVDEDPKRIFIPDLKKANKVVKTSPGATLLDAGDGVLLVEFHTKMNAVDDDIVRALQDAVQLAEDEDWNGVVIGNHADAFSAGANLLLVFMQAQQKAWDALDLMVREFQNANMRLRYSHKPVVAAVGGLALGGGCEIAMHADHAVLAGESYVGLVEVGVGLIPAGGGTKELLVKLGQGTPSGLNVLHLPYVQRAFENIAMAKVMTSGKEAIDAGLFRPWGATVVLNRDHAIHAAKQRVLAMCLAGYTKPKQAKISLAGGNTYGALLIGAEDLKLAGWASEYDIHIAGKLAKVLTGGPDVPEGTIVDEQYVLDLEREAFLSLCGEEKTQARIQHMLTSGKPLRN